MSKLDLAVIAAIILGGVVWVESRHRVVLEPSTHAELASPASGAACPDRESEPYGASCLVFMGGDRVFGIGSQANAAVSASLAPTSVSREAEFLSHAPACPDNDNVPYSESCLRFLSGRYWRPNSAESTPAAPSHAPR